MTLSVNFTLNFFFVIFLCQIKSLIFGLIFATEKFKKYMSINGGLSEMDELKTNSSASRRKFVKRAAAGTALLSLPARSVWANGTVNSIVASGHGSDWASGERIMLRSHDYWKNNISDSDKVTFSSVFGFNAVSKSGNSIELPTYSGGLKAPKLHHFLKTEGVIVGVTDDTEVFVKHTGRFDRWNNPKNEFDLSGPNNVNCHIVSMYLNAKYHGMHGVHYPVLASFGSLQNYVDYLSGLYSSNAGKLGNELAAIIDQCQNGCIASEVTV